MAAIWGISSLVPTHKEPRNEARVLDESDAQHHTKVYIDARDMRKIFFSPTYL